MTASADPWRKSLTRQPYRKIDERMLVANIMASLEELQSLLPPDIDEPQEPDSPEFKEYMRKINRLRRDLRKLKVPQKRNL